MNKISRDTIEELKQRGHKASLDDIKTALMAHIKAAGCSEGEWDRMLNDVLIGCKEANI